jgi:hypothetical protein
MNETLKKIIRTLIYILIIICLYRFINKLFFYESMTPTINSNKNVKFGISTTVKNPHQLNDWIKYHLKIGFNKLYIVFDDENETFIYNDPRVKIFKNNAQWKFEISNLPNMDQFINDTKEVMSRQITNFTNVRNYAKEDDVSWLLHIDGDELFYPNDKSLNNIFNLNNIDSITFQNYEMIPKRDNYENCFISGIDFKINPVIFNAYSNGKSAVRVNSTAIIAGVHGFYGGNNYASPHGKILHYPSCNFDEYISKYKILGKFEDKWWNSVKIPFKFHTESRDIITECSKREESGETNACEYSVRDYYNKSNVYNNNIRSSDIQIIEFVKNVLN